MSNGDDIKKAYKSLSRKYHRDIITEDNAQEMMEKINRAYVVFGNPDKRADYDLDFFGEDNSLGDKQLCSDH